MLGVLAPVRPRVAVACRASHHIICGMHHPLQFKAKLVREVADIKIGQPDDMSTFMTAVIDKPVPP